MPEAVFHAHTQRHARKWAGVFISVEGIDGAGKSSQLAAMGAQLQAAGWSVLHTREPGGTVVGEALRQLLLEQPMGAVSETLAMFAARAEHVRTVIAPALAAGQAVLCDRFTDASFAYQGGGRGVDEGDLMALSRMAQTVRMDGQSVYVEPDCTLWFDLAPATAAARRAAARGADRFEREDLDFFTAVAQGYERRWREAGGRICRIDAAPAPEAVAAQVHAALAQFLQQRGAART